jgi:hypothetical protein
VARGANASLILLKTCDARSYRDCAAAFVPSGVARVGRVRSIAIRGGIALMESCDRARYDVGVSPTISVNRELNDPRDVHPTVMHASVTLIPVRKSAIARSMRRVIK